MHNYQPVHQARNGLFALLAICCSVAHGADETRTQRVHFAKGTSGATLNGSITGYQTVDYLVGAAAGQHMKVSLATQNTANYFNVLEPGQTEVAIFNGSTGDNRFDGVLTKGGDYRIRVYLMRSAARRNEKADYRLTLGIVGAVAATGAAVASGKPDATGRVPCAQHPGQPMAQCEFSVAREGGGNATVTITKPDGSRRAIFFINGKPGGADTAQSDGNTTFNASRQSDLNLIQVGDERYEIPDAAVFGG